LNRVLDEAGISFTNGGGVWSLDEIIQMTQGVVALANKLSNSDNLVALTNLRGMLGGGAYFVRGGDGRNGPDGFAAYVGGGQVIQGEWLGIFNRTVNVFNNAFNVNNNGAPISPDFVRGIVVHELAHVIDFNSALGYQGQSALMTDLGLLPSTFSIGPMAAGGQSYEIFAEAMAQWVYQSPVGNPYRASLRLGNDPLPNLVSQFFGQLGP
jgi:hypothetical protein